jgi:hypothetical protein
MSRSGHANFAARRETGCRASGSVRSALLGIRKAFRSSFSHCGRLPLQQSRASVIIEQPGIANVAP